MSNLCFEFWLIFLIFKMHCVSCALVALASGSNEESAQVFGPGCGGLPGDAQIQTQVAQN